MRVTRSSCRTSGTSPPPGCLAEAGFPALGTTSLGVAAAHGLPDGVGAADEETLRLTRRLADLPLHVTVDIETGSVGRGRRRRRRPARPAVNIEDALRPATEHAALIRAVKREAPQLFVNARTDTHWQRPGDLTEAVRRVRRYADAGADGVFVPGLAEPADIAAVVAAVEVPVNVLFLPGRHTVAALAAARRTADQHRLAALPRRPGRVGGDGARRPRRLAGPGRPAFLRRGRCRAGAGIRLRSRDLTRSLP